MIALFQSHPALGVVLCCTTVAVAVLGYLAVRRVCDAAERCMKLRAGRTRSRDAVPELREETPAVKVDVITERETSLRQGLKSLGYKEFEIEKVVTQLDMRANVDVLLRQALAKMPNRAKMC